MKALKSFGIAICAFLAFCVVVAIFDDNDSSSENKTEPQQTEQTEQKQETEAERKAREQKEEADRKAREKEETEKKKTELAKEAYNEGYEEGYKATSAMYATLNPQNIARDKYVTWNGAPKTPEEKELCNIYIENFAKGWKEGHYAQ